MSHQRQIISMFVFSLAVIVVSLFHGEVEIDIADLFQEGANISLEVFLNLRLPRVLTAFVAGAGLSVCGMVFQSLFRNKLATPYTLGVASGASLGATVYIFGGLQLSLFVFDGIMAFSFIGAAMTIAIVYFLGLSQGRLMTGTLLLGGVAMSLFFSSLILFFQFLSDEMNSMKIIRWLMGGVDVVGMESVYRLLPFVGVVVAVAFYKSRELNLVSMGDDIAITRGVNIEVLRKTLFLIVSLAIAGVVSECGPIGFVGLMVPHICRQLVGEDHRRLSAVVPVVGGGFLVACDLASRTLLASSVLPLGIITSMLGGPFFLFLLLRRRLS